MVVTSTKKRRGKRTKQDEVLEYAEPLFMPSNLKILTTVGSLIFCRKVDVFDPKIVRTIRFFFILHLILQQLFIVYVHIRAKMNNDRTSIETTNPVSALLQQGQLDAMGGQAEMVKNLASTFLKSQTTVMEYDRKQASQMQGKIITEMIFMWFLHFKLGQIQPILMSVVNGLIQLFYNPLFQVYVMGRNLERPFKSPPKPMAPPGLTNEENSDETETENSDENAIVDSNTAESNNNEDNDEDEDQEDGNDDDDDDGDGDDAESEAVDEDDDDDDEDNEE
mmetsp:Transcript_53342/g.129686  ORF Transcript_53342/g.129686 Transcript_53342/m.129686 type:complete len:279 (+) Transcript_53342:2718-3554(+)